MSEAEYRAWILFHRDLFQMKSADDLPMFAAWAPSLSEFSEAELRAASLAIAAGADTAQPFEMFSGASSRSRGLFVHARCRVLTCT